MLSEYHACLILRQLGATEPQLMAVWRRGGTFASLLRGTAKDIPADLRALVDAYDSNPHYLQTVAEQQADRLGDVHFITLRDAAYPALLRELSSPPPFLYVRGNPVALSQPQIAMVGSRRASMSGLETARSFARDLAGHGFTITSGLAVGIDAAAHQGALESGNTVAVLGTGIDLFYPPEHRALHDRIVANGGAVVTPFHPGIPARPENFPQRNRIISGLSLGVVVVEGAVKSGSLITARYGLSQGREVFAIPGSIHHAQSRGCHQLIRAGATLVETSADIVEQLGGLLAYKAEEARGLANRRGVSQKSRRRPPSQAALENEGLSGEYQGLTDEESRLIDCIGHDPADTDTLVSRSGLGIGQLTSLLVGLELKGIIQPCEGGRYSKL